MSMKKNISIRSKNQLDLHSSDIDAVVLWVDGNDAEWQKKRSQYMPEEDCDSSPNRYRDWDNLRYWFRGIAKFAPWVNKIHFVTDGQTPEWLNIDHPRIFLVDHKDYMPPDALPVFNSNAIEIGMHKISGLADRFILFNDDVFLTAPVDPEYYFSQGTPVDMAGLTRPATRETVFGSLMMNNYEILNRRFSKKEALKKNFSKWFCPRYGKNFVRTLMNLRTSEFQGIVIPHLSVPYRKSDISRVWDQEGELLQKTQYHRFRSPDDITHLLFRFWRLAEGDFKPRKSKGKYFSAENYQSVEKIAEAIVAQRYPEICINDCYQGEDFEKAKNLLISSFEKILGDKCEYEKA